jgi:hypothetical protein
VPTFPIVSTTVGPHDEKAVQPYPRPKRPITARKHRQSQAVSEGHDQGEKSLLIGRFYLRCQRSLQQEVAGSNPAGSTSEGGDLQRFSSGRLVWLRSSDASVPSAWTTSILRGSFRPLVSGATRRTVAPASNAASPAGGVVGGAASAFFAVAGRSVSAIERADRFAI